MVRRTKIYKNIKMNIKKNQNIHNAKKPIQKTIKNISYTKK